MPPVSMPEERREEAGIWRKFGAARTQLEVAVYLSICKVLA